MPKKTRVILITDGDGVAQSVVEGIAHDFKLRCISASAGNPTPIDGAEIVRLLKETPYDPVLVMFDDKGLSEKGRGELALEYVANHPDVEVLGAVAVASNTMDFGGAAADFCVAKDGTLTENAVNKNGDKLHKSSLQDKTIIRGDTVDVLNEVEIPLVVGVGDIGKMKHKDDIHKGSPVTRRAIAEILTRSGVVPPEG